MNTSAVIPILPLTDLARIKLTAAAILARLPARVPVVAYRAPDVAHAERWKRHVIGGHAYEIAQPVTFTPYASAKPCSARCRFCSETLIESDAGKPSSSLRPGADYFTSLRGALDELAGLPISYSLSGLETTDDPAWMMQMLDVLQQHARRSPVLDRVLYTNGAGLADGQQGEQLIERLAAFGISWIELSRHHFEEAANQAIMRFHPRFEILRQAHFESTVRRLAGRMPVKQVCIVQKGGVDSVEGVMAYLNWAASLGASSVVFREFSKLDDRYADNVTARYVASGRIEVDALLQQCLQWQPFSAQFSAERVTQGYYFWNIVGRYRGMEVVFEASDYTLMHRMHDSGRVYKLVFHANGNLCADWNPQRHVLWRSPG